VRTKELKNLRTEEQKEVKAQAKAPAAAQKLKTLRERIHERVTEKGGG
jgi:hypothetical protein